MQRGKTQWPAVNTLLYARGKCVLWLIVLVILDRGAGCVTVVVGGVCCAVLRRPGAAVGKYRTKPYHLKKT